MLKMLYLPVDKTLEEVIIMAGKKPYWRIAALLAAVVMAGGAMQGCGNEEQTSSAGNATDPISVPSDLSDYEALDISGATLTYWFPMWANEAEVAQNVGEYEIYKRIEEKTGVHVEFTSPPSTDITQAFMTLVASKDLPDIIMQEYYVEYPGGPDKAIEDGVYLRLNELMEKYAPNYLAAISDPDVYKQAVTDTGNLYCFSMVDTYAQPAYYGPMYRRDWLDKLGLEVPTTMDEVHNVLTAFKNELGAAAPMLLPQNGYDGSGYMLMSAYGVNNTYYNDNGTVKFGPAQDGWRQYLETMAQWYSEGLIDPEFPTKTDTTSDITTDKAGMWVGNFWSPGTWQSQSVSPDEFEVVAGPYPSLNEGEKVAFRQTNNVIQQNHTAVTTACKTPEIAVKWLDYKYSEEAFMLCNYGIEGESYTIVDGEPKYTEFFTENKNPKGFPYATAQYYYLIGKGPYLRQWDREMFTYEGLALYEKQSAMDMMNTWQDSSTGEAIIPAALTQTSEEGEALNVIQSDVTTYVNQQTVAFITGQQELNDDTWNEYIETLNRMGIEEAVSYKQAAYDRYQKR